MTERLLTRLRLNTWTLVGSGVLLALSVGCSSGDSTDGAGDPDDQEPDDQEPDDQEPDGPMCEASDEEESACSDGADDDCDGFVDEGACPAPQQCQLSGGGYRCCIPGGDNSLGNCSMCCSGTCIFLTQICSDH